MGRWGARRVARAGAALLGLLVLAPSQADAGRAQAAGPLDGTPLCGVADPTGGAAAAPDDGVLRIATFNLLHSETDDGDRTLGARLPLLADAIARSGADAVGAQEVTRNMTFDPAAEAPQRHGLVAERLAAAVAARTGEPWSWCWSLSNPHVPLTPDLDLGGGNPLDAQAAAVGNFPDPGDFRDGVAVLTRFRIDASRFRRLPPRSYEAVACTDLDPLCSLAALFDSRQVLWTRLATPAGGFDFFTTHLAHGLTPLSDTTKLLQMQAALAITAEWATPDALPDLLVGDLNSVPGSPVLDAGAAAGFVDTYGAAGGAPCAAPGDAGCSGGPPDGQEVETAVAERPMSGRIDHVLARPPSGCSLTVPDSDVIGDEPSQQVDGTWLWPSDHLGFASTIACGAAAASAAGAATGGAELPATGGEGPSPWTLVTLLAGFALWAARRAPRYSTK